MMPSVVWLLLVAALGSGGGWQVGGLPQPPARDPRAPLTVGTGLISGRVVTADTGVAARRAIVTLLGVARNRSTIADDEGKFVFSELPAGRYTVSATPGPHRLAYRGASYGAPRQGGAGRPIQLADGQRVDNLTIALPRSGLITGRVLDLSGEPLARVQIRALMFRLGNEPFATASSTTDDLGQFRLPGLAPGDYIVMAEALPMGVPADLEGEPVGFAPTYAPGTAARHEAYRIRVGEGTEANADIRLIETRVFRISGTAQLSTGEPIERPSVQLLRADAGAGGFSIGAAAAPGGRFVFRSVPPGQYNLVARYSKPRSASQPPGPPHEELVIQPIDVTTADVEVVLVLRTPETVTGRIRFEPEAPPDVRVNMQAQTVGPRPLIPQPKAEAQGDRFTVSDIFGPFLLRGNAAGGPGNWIIKAVLLDGQDVTDVPIAYSSAYNSRVQIVFTLAAASLEGIVTDENGEPTRNATVILFGEDESSWIPWSSRTRLTGIGSDEGKFSMRNLREGRYYAVAIPPLMMVNPQMMDREVLESLRKVAIAVTLTPGETRTVDLRVVPFER